MKKLFILVCLFVLCFTMTGCDFIKRDNMEDISIITTVYPLEYIINRLYGEHSLIASIYPDGVNIETETLNEQQFETLSKKDLFIYLGLGKDKDIALTLRNKNDDLLIIDGSYGMSSESIEELWLNPSNLLTITKNIKNGLIEYINNTYLIKAIEEEYEQIKLELSELDADIKLTFENASSKTIITSSKALLFLEKYGLDVIIINEETTEKVLDDVNNLINDKQIKYLYVLENEELNEVAKTLLSATSIKELKLRKINNLTEDERNDKKDYFTLMNENIELLRKETYK